MHLLIKARSLRLESIHPILLLALILAVLFFTSFTVRMVWTANEQLDLARYHQHQGDIYRAMLGYERSIHAYVPWLSRPSVSVS